MTFPVITGTFGTIEANLLTVGWDTDNPRTDGPGTSGERLVVDGMSASWVIDVLPPVAQPSVVQFLVYMPGPDPEGTWLPWDQGEPISVAVHAYTDSAPVELWTFKGRVQDVSGVNHQAGGILFRVICVDRLADLASSGAPEQLVPASNQSDLAPGLFDVYEQLADDAGVDFDWQAGAGFTLPYWWHLVAPIDATNTTTLDTLSTAVTHDVRPNADPNIEPVVHNVDRWLTQQIDTGSSDPEAVARYRLNEWDPLDVNGLAGVAAFHWTGTEWTLQALDVNGYYSGGGSGMVLAADQLARDVGEWRQTRDQAINTIELNSPTAFDTGAQSTRSSYTDLVALYGRNTRSVPAWWAERDDAQAWGYELLQPRDQLQVSGYGFTQLVVAWEQLTDDQLASWASELWPRFGVAPLGRSFAVVGIPEHWRLAPGPVVTGRLMGCTITLQGGTVRHTLTTRAVPPSAVDGVTPDDIDTFAGPEMTPDNIDPSITVDSLAVVGPTAV